MELRMISRSWKEERDIKFFVLLLDCFDSWNWNAPEQEEIDTEKSIFQYL